MKKGADGEILLTGPQHQLLQQAMDAAFTVTETMSQAYAGLGRWLLTNLFGGDTTRALTRRGRHPVWRELMRRAGGPTVELTDEALSVTLRCAANDKALSDPDFTALDIFRKKYLLPLKEPALLREAAQHVKSFELTHEATIAYVGSLMKKAGQTRQIRITTNQATSRLDDVIYSLGRPKVATVLKAKLAAATPAERRLFRRRVREAKAMLEKYEKFVDGLDDD